VTRFVLVSDTHNQHSSVQLPDGDVLIHSGDFSFNGNMKEYKNFFFWLEGQEKRYKHVIWVAGNHDGNRFVEERGEAWLEETFVEVPGIYLQDTSVVVAGYRVYGSPWTPQFGNWSFMESRDAIKQKWDAIPEDTEILVTHGPPFEIGDRNSSQDPCGCGWLKQRVKELPDLKMHVFGHIHESAGEHSLFGSDIKFVNASICTSAYKPTNKPIVIDLPTKVFEWNC